MLRPVLSPVTSQWVASCPTMPQPAAAGARLAMHPVSALIMDSNPGVIAVPDFDSEDEPAARLPGLAVQYGVRG